jgi:hypothetical protein
MSDNLLFDHASIDAANKLLKERLSFYPSYGFLYIVSCDHWIRNGEKCYKFGRTSQPLLRRCLNYNPGFFGNLSLICYYLVTNAKDLEDRIKEQVSPFVVRGDEWVRMKLEDLILTIQSLLEPATILMKQQAQKAREKTFMEYHVASPQVKPKHVDDDEEIRVPPGFFVFDSPTKFPPSQRRTTLITDRSSLPPLVSNPCLSVQKGISLIAPRGLVRAACTVNYRVECKYFSFKKEPLEQAIAKAIEWRNSTQQSRKTEPSAKRNLEPPSEFLNRVKRCRGVRISKHNGAFEVFIQKQNVTYRQRFSYVKDDPRKAFENALNLRQTLEQESVMQIRARKRKRQLPTFPEVPLRG